MQLHPADLPLYLTLFHDIYPTKTYWTNLSSLGSVMTSTTSNHYNLIVSPSLSLKYELRTDWLTKRFCYTRRGLWYGSWSFIWMKTRINYTCNMKSLRKKNSNEANRHYEINKSQRPLHVRFLLFLFKIIIITIVCISTGHSKLAWKSCGRATNQNWRHN